MKTCGFCKMDGENKSTHVDTTSSPNRPIVFRRYVCKNLKCQNHKRWIGDEGILMRNIK